MTKKVEGERENKTTTQGRALDRRSILLGGTTLAAAAARLGAAAPVTMTQAQAQPQPSPAAAGRKPNILVIWGDDIGWQNVSAYGMGTMGYTTPNIERIGLEGIRFVDHYAQPSCTAGRAAFITGQYPIRSGMTTVGQPGDALGLQAVSPCLAEVMKAAGYATGHFGKNHLGDRNEHLPTVHGFDEFFGNLYHLNTQEDSEQRDYQAFAGKYSGNLDAYEKKFGTRGVNGVNNLDYWTGKSQSSARDHIFHYYESKLTAVRMGPWKFHFSTKEDYYANVVPLTVPLVFNIRMDPFESYSNKDSYGHLMQKVSWMMAPMGELMHAHLQSLADYPPVQGGKSFDMSNVVKEFIDKAMQ